MGRDAKVFIVDKIKPDTPPGAIQLAYLDERDVIVRGFNHNCPCGCGSLSYMGIDRSVNVNTACWTVESGNFRDVSTLTLSPSVGIGSGRGPNGGFHWHGYLENGMFVER